MEETGMKCIDWYGYTVCSDGSILNKDGSLKQPKTSPKGYLFSNFYVGNRLITKTFHSIVAEVFLGKRPEGYEVDHKNNIRNDNRLDNLEYLTKSQNNKKAYDSGNRMFVFGQSNPNSLTRKGKLNGPRTKTGEAYERS